MPEVLVTQAQFRERLQELVERCHRILAEGPRALTGKPEDFTDDRLVRPLLAALNFPETFRIPQNAIPKAAEEGLTWVDFALLDSERKLHLGFVEIKSVFEDDIWNRYKDQIINYIRNYLYSLRLEQPTKWIILTNFRELHIINVLDRKREPFISLRFTDFPGHAGEIWSMLERSFLEKDQLERVYYEKANFPLNKSFLADLKRWREIIANGLLTVAPQLNIGQVRALSAVILDRLILVRFLESRGLQNYYSLVKLFRTWDENTRNKSAFPFYGELATVFRDLELDFDTELLKEEAVDAVVRDIRAKGFAGELIVPNAFIQAVVVPDDYPTEVNQYVSDNAVQLLPRTIYNYDFNSLTDDVIGAVYEQYLGHRLELVNAKVVIQLDPTRRQEEGAYYTPFSVVQYLVDSTLKVQAREYLERSIAFLNASQFLQAHAEILKLDRLRAIDIACGSGAFLIYAFDVLKDAFEEYNIKLAAAVQQNFGGGDIFAQAPLNLYTITDIADRILRNNLFGVDMDPQAVEIARMNLWFKLVRSDDRGFYARADNQTPKKLPALDQNIFCRDSIHPYLDLGDLIPEGERVFFGNPPWGAYFPYKNQLPERYELARGQFDSYEIFVEKIVRDMRPGEMLGYIIPDSILLPEHERTRKYLTEKCAIYKVVKVGEGLFEGVYRAAVTIVVSKGSPPADHKVLTTVVTKADRERLIESRYG